MLAHWPKVGLLGVGKKFMIRELGSHHVILSDLPSGLSQACYFYHVFQVGCKAEKATYTIIDPCGQVPVPPAGNLIRFPKLVLGLTEELVVSNVANGGGIPRHNLGSIAASPL